MAAIALVALAQAPHAARFQASPSLSSFSTGLAFLAFALWRTTGQAGALWLNIAPAFFALALALLAGDWLGVLRFWREAFVVCGLISSYFVEIVFLELLGFDLAPSTAQVTAGMLRLGGWQATAHDVMVSLPDCSIVVSQGCSGLKTVFFLTGFAVVVLLLHPFRKALQNAAVLFAAMVIGYFVNAVRVGILAILASAGDENGFQFWHVKQGAMIFEVAAVAIFLGFFYLVMPTKQAPAADSAPSS